MQPYHQKYQETELRDIGDSNIVDVYIRYLRHKIDDRYHIKTIHTIRSVGYLFNYEEDEE